MDKDLVVIKAIIDADYKRHLRRFDHDRQKGDVLLLGDSIIAYMPQSKMPGLWVNQGIPGDTTKGVLNRLDRVLIAEPKTVILHIGSNDFVLLREEPKQIFKRIIDIIIELERVGITVWVLSITPILSSHIKTNQTYVKHRNNGMIAALNRTLESRVKHYLDVHSALIDDTGQLNPDYTTDGVHLTDLGYDVCLEVIKQAVT